MNPTPPELAPEPPAAAIKRPTKEQLRRAVQAQLRKTGLNRHGRRALIAQVRGKVKGRHVHKRAARKLDGVK